MTVDEYKAPVVAAWQAGIGRVLCYTGEADGAHTGPIAGWKNVGNFLTSLARWTAGESENLPDGMLLTQRVKDGISVVQLHLDPEREGEVFRELPTVKVLRGVVGETPSVNETKLSWTAADTLAVDIPIHGSETVLTTVEIPGGGNISLPPVCLPYSPEFKPVHTESGLTTMERLAKATDGKQRINLGEIWDDLPRQPRLISLQPWLLIAALLLLLFETLERRTGLLSMRHGRRLVEVVSQRIPRKERAVTPGTAPPAEEEMTPSIPDESEKPEVSSDRDGMLDALSRARKRASRRTGR